MAMSAPPEPLVLSTNTFMDLPAGADSSGKEIRARSLAEPPRLPADAGSEHAPRCARARREHGSRPQ